MIYKNSPLGHVAEGTLSFLIIRLLHDVPVASQEEGCDDGDVEHADAGREEVHLRIEVVVADADDGGEADDIEAEFILFEHEQDAEQRDDVRYRGRHEVVCPWERAVVDEVGDRAAE